MRQNGEIRLVTFLLLMAAASPALAADLKEVQSFGDNPSNTRMFIYVPDQLAASPPILVAIHYCTGSAMAFFTGTTYRMQADRHGFIVVYPETTADDKCFDVHSPETLKHDGAGESNAIASMVRYTLREYKADASRVYVTGTSSGAMMTNVMLGAYPDMFRAGSAFAGVPFGCFAGADRWNSDCAMGKTTKTGQEWGDLVRAAYPDYAGPRPRMQLWHGDGDETLSFHNFGEEIKEWTNVLGVSEMPTNTESNAPAAPWTRTRYADAMGVVQVEAMVGPGMSHNLTVLSDEAVRFFQLDVAVGGAAMTAAAGSSAAGSGAAGTTGAAAANGGASTSSAAGSGAGTTGPAAASGGASAAGPAATSGGVSASPAAASGGVSASPAAASGGVSASPAAASGGASAAKSGAAGTVARATAAAPSGAASSSRTDATTEPTAAPGAMESSCTVGLGRAAGQSNTAWLGAALGGLFLAVRRHRRASSATRKPRARVWVTCAIFRDNPASRRS